MASHELRLVLGTRLGRFRLRLGSLKPDKGKLRAANVGPATAVRMVVEERLEQILRLRVTRCSQSGCELEGYTLAQRLCLAAGTQEFECCGRTL